MGNFFSVVTNIKYWKAFFHKSTWDDPRVTKSDKALAIVSLLSMLVTLGLSLYYFKEIEDSKYLTYLLLILFVVLLFQLAASVYLLTSHLKL